MKKKYALLVALIFALNGWSQVVTNYNAKWFLGLNTGATWQTTDVRNQMNGGFGFYLGKSFNYNYGRFASFDLRARFLRGFWYGQDRSVSDFSQPNNTLSSEPTNYKDSLGYSVNNFQAETYRLGFELVLHANALRERTRWDPYIFGGIGFTWFQTYGDLLYTDTITGGQNLYQYQPANLSNTSLKNLKDGVYETALDGSLQNKYTLNVMPSLGFGLGYQLGKGTTIGIEHKTTFTGIDDFDGVVKQSKYTQDLYHYTNVYLQFRLGRGKATQEENENNPPEVNFTNPGTSYKEVTDSVFILQAEVLRVFTKENLTFIQNGGQNRNYSFNEKSNRFSAQVNLASGQNTFILFGVNQYGSDADTVVLVYKRAINNNGPSTSIPLPVVTFQQPSSTTTTVNSATYNVAATVLNVANKSNIQVTLNGASRTDFQYEESTKKVYFTANLNLGSNEVRINGTNSAGMDEEMVTIVYQRPANQPLPVVNFTDPSSTPITVSISSFTLQAQLQYVNNSANILFKQNGQNLTGFQFNPSTGAFSGNVLLVAGNNLFEIYGTNETGSASDQTVINYNRPAPRPPIVSITQPSQSSTTSSSANFQFVGRVLNVTDKSGVRFNVNGEDRTNFSFNSNDGSVTANVVLQTGNNVLKLTGTNTDGMDSKEVTILYRPATTVQPPVVTFTSPNSSSTTVRVANYSVQASVTNVTEVSGIAVKVNGANYSSFTYNGGFVGLNLSLIEGANVVEIRGTNTAGTDAKTASIIYKKEATVYPPIVTFLQPNSNPANYQQAANAVIAKVDNVNSKNEIQVKINGQATSNFNYSVSSHQVTFDVVLIEGSNSVEIIGTNSAGSDAETTIMIYRPYVPKPPTVDIENPATSPFNTTTANISIRANTSNILDKSQVKLLFNGQSMTNFSFNSQTGVVTYNALLAEGNNNVEITVTNADGNASDNATIVYKKPVVVQAPTVVFTAPDKPGSTVNSEKYTVEAKIFNIDNSSQIQFKMNGAIVQSNNWTYAVNTKVFSFLSNLQVGNNQFEIVATNEGGSGNAQINLTYQKPIAPCKNPVVRFLDPVKNGTVVEQASYKILFGVDEMNGSKDVNVRVNGTLVNAIQKSSGEYEVFTNLTKGNNIVEVTAQNTCGETTATISIEYKPSQLPCVEPLFTLMQPSTLLEKVEEINFALAIGLSGMNASAQIQFTVNGQQANFTFDQAAHILRANLSLKEGKNTIQIKATNDCGSAEIKLEIERFVCEQPIIQLVYANIANNVSTANRQLVLDLGLTHVSSVAQISVKLNGQTIPFDFDSNTKTVNINRMLNLGTASLVVTAKNDCGTATYNHKVFIIKSEVNPPTVLFLNPITASTQVVNGNFHVVIQTTNILNATGIYFKLNGNPLPVQFDYTTQKAELDIALTQGTNLLEVQVANSAGAVGAQANIEFTPQKSAIVPPVIQLNGTSAKIQTVGLGSKKISGKVKNVTSANALVVKMNGKPVGRINSTLVNGELLFDFNINMVQTMPTQVIEITATNEAGRDQQFVTFKLETKTMDQDAPANPTPPGGRKQ